MKLSVDSLIASEKLTRYLLVPRKRNDKSNWLAQAGYSLENWRMLEFDLRSQVLSLEAVLVEPTPYGDRYEIRANLIGPNGKTLAVVSVWMTENRNRGNEIHYDVPGQGVENDVQTF